MMKVKLLGVKIDTFEAKEVVLWVKESLKRKKKFWIATPNPEMVVAAKEDESFREVLNSADLAIPDGVGLVWAARILGLPLKKRVTGTDLLAKLCQKAAQEGWNTAFLGGREGVAQEALVKLQKLYPGLEGIALEGPKKLLITNYPGKARSCSAGQLLISDQERNREAIEKINNFKPDLLFVAFGMNKQERWILKYFDTLDIGGVMVVGGAFDFVSGRVRRAPVWLQNLGLEWLFRLLLQPWRVKRQIALLKFIFLVVKEKFEKEQIS